MSIVEWFEHLAEDVKQLLVGGVCIDQGRYLRRWASQLTPRSSKKAYRSENVSHSSAKSASGLLNSCSCAGASEKLIVKISNSVQQVRRWRDFKI